MMFRIEQIGTNLTSKELIEKIDSSINNGIEFRLFQSSMYMITKDNSDNTYTLNQVFQPDSIRYCP